MASDGGTDAASPEQATHPAAGQPSVASMRRLAERAAELYLEAADGARDEQALLRLQSCADRAIARLAQLGALATGAEPADG